MKPLQRKYDTLETENQELRDSLLKATTREIKRTVDDAVRSAAKELKVLDSATDDALLLGGQMLKPNEDGTVTTEDGLTPKQWLEDLQTVKTHWWPPSQGGGAGGGGGGLGNVGANPFSFEHWNLTKQGKLYRENPERAGQLAKAAGTTIGGKKPLPKK